MKNVVMYDAIITRRVKSRPDRPPTITSGEGMNFDVANSKEEIEAPELVARPTMRVLAKRYW